VTQTVELVAPFGTEYVPAPQVTHAVAPAGEYVPEGHAVHAEPVFEIRIRILQLLTLYIDPDEDK
jgi:hypothetical protein